MAQYPTKEDILATKPEFDKRMLWCFRQWKAITIPNWKNLDKSQKTLCLEFLIYVITPYYNKEIPKVKWDKEYKYNTRTKTIFLNQNNPSIISTLHELAHHLYGPSELKACQWSIHLFKQQFPNSYKKLKWEGHKLTK